MERFHSPRRRAPAATALALALAAILLAGSAAPAASGPAARTVLRAETARVEIENFAFSPRTLRIRRGTRVVFANRDRTAHTATRRGSFDTGTIPSGRKAAVRFKRRGTFKYICTIHPDMHGKIVVR